MMLANNFPKLTKDKRTQAQEALQTAGSIIPSNIPRYIAVKQLEIKDREKEKSRKQQNDRPKYRHINNYIKCKCLEYTD